MRGKKEKVMLAEKASEKNKRRKWASKKQKSAKRGREGEDLKS